MLLIIDPDVKNIFVNLDISELKHAFMSCTAPPTDQLACGDIVIEGKIDQHICLDRVRDGSVCGRRFDSYRQLVAHRLSASSLGGDHGVATVGSLVVCNACCFCGEVLVSKASAQMHVRNSYTRGYCVKGMARIYAVLVPPVFPIICKITGQQFSKVADYNSRLAQVLPFVPKVVVSGGVGKHDRCAHEADRNQRAAAAVCSAIVARRSSNWSPRGQKKEEHGVAAVRSAITVVHEVEAQQQFRRGATSAT